MNFTYINSTELIATGHIAFSSEELSLFRVLCRVLSGMSITGLIFVHILFWFFKDIRSFALELVVWLCSSNILFNLTNFLYVYDHEDTIDAYHSGSLSFTCQAQGFLNIIGDLSSMIWTTIIGYTAYISVSRQEHLDNNRTRYKIGYICVAYGIPLSFSLIVLLMKKFGPSGVFCWIITVEDNFWSNAFTIFYYSFTWFIIILNCAFVIRLILLLKVELQNEEALIDRYTHKLRMYPIVQIISFIPATINRVYGLATGGQVNFYLMLIQIIFDSLTGLMFSLVYGFNPSVKAAFVECIRAVCCRKPRSSISSHRTTNENNISSNDDFQTGARNRGKSLTYIDETMISDVS